MPLAVAILVGLPMAVMVAAVVADSVAGGGAGGQPSADGRGGPAPPPGPGPARRVQPPPPGIPDPPPARPAPSPDGVLWRVRPRLRLVRRVRRDLAEAWFARARGALVEVRGPEAFRLRGRILAYGPRGVVIGAGEPVLVPRRAIWSVRLLSRARRDAVRRGRD